MSQRTIGLIGRKVGMMRIFNEDGTSVPVTVLDCAGNRVTQIKKPDTDGYAAVQVTYGKRRASRVTKAMAGHFAAVAGVLVAGLVALNAIFQIAFYGGLRNLLRNWRVMHASLAVFLVLVMAAHIGVSLYLGYGLK